MFDRTWTWVTPLAVGAVVIGFVLATTPPGFGAVVDIVLGSPRGNLADADAYALGTAASLGLVALIAMAVLCAGLAAIADSLRALRRKR